MVKLLTRGRLRKVVVLCRRLRDLQSTANTDRMRISARERLRGVMSVLKILGLSKEAKEVHE